MILVNHFGPCCLHFHDYGAIVAAVVVPVDVD